MNPLLIVLLAAAFACGWLIRAVWWTDPADIVELRKERTALRQALAESVALSAERFDEMQTMCNELDALEQERDGLRGAHNNLRQVVELHAFECPCDADTKDALRRAHHTTLANHGVAA